MPSTTPDFRIAGSPSCSRTTSACGGSGCGSGFVSCAARLARDSGGHTASNEVACGLARGGERNGASIAGPARFSITGGAGGDTLRGGQGDDVIVGGPGNDWISGDLGNDTLTGGGGADIFHASHGVDRVTDFNQDEGDRVLLDPGVAYVLTQVGPDAVLDLGQGDEMILAGVQAASLRPGWVFWG